MKMLVQTRGVNRTVNHDTISILSASDNIFADTSKNVINVPSINCLDLINKKQI